MQPRKTSLKRLFFFYMTLVGITTVLALGTLRIFAELSGFKKESETLRASHLEDQKAVLVREVSQAHDFVKYMQSQTENRLRDSIRDRVNEAHAIAENIYKIQKENNDPAEIAILIREALRPIRFNHGRGYYFAFTLDGIETLFAANPEMEGKDMLTVQGGAGERVVPEMLALVREKGEGYYTYTWTKPEQDGFFPKIAFVKLFEPLGWVIGTGEYLDDVEADIQAECLQWIANIQFGNGGYVFAGQWDGLSLAGPGAGENMYDIKDPNGVKIVQEMIRAAQSGGGYVHYIQPPFQGRKQAPKLGYTVGVPQWRWYIGSGVYLDEIETAIAHKQTALQTKIRLLIRNTVAIIVVLLGCITVIVKLLTNRIDASLSHFAAFFNRASAEAARIDQKDVHFAEFTQLAESANDMVAKRRKAEKALRESEERR